jgi:hypothetical protein
MSVAWPDPESTATRLNARGGSAGRGSSKNVLVSKMNSCCVWIVPPDSARSASGPDLRKTL